MKPIFLLGVAAACTGGTPATKRGPDPAWHATIDKETYEAVAAGGGLVTIDEQGVALRRDGTTAWTQKLPGAMSGWLIAHDDTVLAGDDAGHVVAIALADGAIRWTVETPPPEGGTDHPFVNAAATAAGRLVLLDAYGRFLAVDPAACARGASTCLVPTGAVKSTFDADHLALTDDGIRVAWEFSAVVLYDPAGERIAAFRAADLLGGVVTAGADVVVSHDEGVVRLHPAKCRVDIDTTIRLADAEATAPPGCLDIIHRGPVDAAPAASTAGIAWVNEQEVAGRSTRSWRIGMERAHVGSQLAGAGPVAYVACWQEPEGNDLFVTVPDLCTIDLMTGGVTRRSRLGIRAQGLLHDPWVVVSDALVFVVLGDQLAAVPRG